MEGTEGHGHIMYREKLTARPYPNPNFNNPNDFRDDTLAIFGDTYPSKRMVDRALTQLNDPGLLADVQRFRRYKKEVEDRTTRLAELRVQAEVAHHHAMECAQRLANARGPTRIVTQIVQYAPEAERRASLP